jgi:uncharacterized protein
MNTPWGEVKVRDAHAHLFSHGFFQALAKQRGRSESVQDLTGQLGWTAPPEDNRELARLWASELNRHGVAGSVLMSSVPGDEASAAEVRTTQPDRFYGYFMLDPLAADAPERARRAFDELGLQGLCLFPAMHGFSVQDDRVRPLYELAARKTGVVVFVHMGVLTVGVRRKLGLPSRFDMTRSNPIDLHRIALEYPGVNFVIPHFGAGYFRETLMLGDLVPNVYVDTSSSNGWMRYLLPQITLVDVFRKALEVFGCDRVLFGSDSSFFPRGWNREVFDTQADVLTGLKADEATARAVFGGNLKTLLQPPT